MMNGIFKLVVVLVVDCLKETKMSVLCTRTYTIFRYMVRLVGKYLMTN